MITDSQRLKIEFRFNSLNSNHITKFQQSPLKSQKCDFNSQQLFSISVGISTYIHTHTRDEHSNNIKTEKISSPIIPNHNHLISPAAIRIYTYIYILHAARGAKIYIHLKAHT